MRRRVPFGARARINKRGTDVELSADYKFTQKTGVGHFDQAQPLRFVTIRKTFEQRGDASEGSRSSVYRKVAEMCEMLRRSEGNCGLSRIRLTAGANEKEIRVRVLMGNLQRRG